MPTNPSSMFSFSASRTMVGLAPCAEQRSPWFALLELCREPLLSIDRLSSGNTTTSRALEECPFGPRSWFARFPAAADRRLGPHSRRGCQAIRRRASGRGRAAAKTDTLRLHRPPRAVLTLRRRFHRRRRRGGGSDALVPAASSPTPPPATAASLLGWVVLDFEGVPRDPA